MRTLISSGHWKYLRLLCLKYSSVYCQYHHVARFLSPRIHVWFTRYPSGKSSELSVSSHSLSQSTWRMWPIGSPAQLAGSCESSFCMEERHALPTSSMNTSAWAREWTEHCYLLLYLTKSPAERNQGWEPQAPLQWLWKPWPWGSR